jgi:hypothetical protein
MIKGVDPNLYAKVYGQNAGPYRLFRPAAQGYATTVAGSSIYANYANVVAKLSNYIRIHEDIIRWK